MCAMMDGMGWWMMGGMSLIGLLVLILLVLGIAALVKFLRSGRWSETSDDRDNA